ncbi:hypothetical protein GCM10009504_28470 [Pseudomonas laurentiana]|uniref:mannuronan 5-epimerase n=1 Tax=Pseudomonas laurentiana TaxID=2364649 RepID=A0A6I5RVX3_9PSED|nr:right-handed parallel beta-helix repeat-containing protein [Pseudomonas laurentiana]NES11746.1 hypothetical protein [Pseudomonas laurentiana]GGU69594.1 hypothetical protein GCM10009504_28470 [Pseudomonas laurentiana]
MNRIFANLTSLRTTILLVFSLWGHTTLANPATVQQISSLPYTISVPGHYTLSASLETQGNGIQIAADNVVLDLGGHTLSGPRTPDNAFYGISAFGHKALEIRNGTLSGFQYAVYISGYFDRAKTSDDMGEGKHLVERLTIHDSTFRGIRVEGNNSVIRNNTITDIGGSTGIANAYAMGIEVYGKDIQVSDNTIEEVRGSGVKDIGEGVGICLTHFGDGSIVRGNRISNRSLELTSDMPAWHTRSRSTYGIWVGGDGATDVLVKGNTVKNFIHGITFKRSEAGAIRDNDVTQSLIPYYLPDNHDKTRVKDLGNNTSDQQTLILKHGRSTPGQIETVEPEYATYLSPLHRLRYHNFLPVPNLTPGDDKLIAKDQATMVDYWHPHTAGQKPRPVKVDLDDGRAFGCCGNDHLKNIQGAQGTPYNDILLGNDDSNLLAGAEGDDHIEGRAGDDFLFGDAGNDQLFGNEGDDVLDGGLGDDVLWGGPGADSFIFWEKQDSGNDIIMDFSGYAGEKDVIDLTGNLASFVEVMALTAQQGDDAVIRLNETSTITLKNIRKDQLTPLDFIF